MKRIRLLAWSTAAACLALAVTVRVLEAQQASFVRQDNGVFRQSAKIFPCTYLDAGATNPATFNDEGRICWDSTLGCVVVWNSGRAKQICINGAGAPDGGAQSEWEYTNGNLHPKRDGGSVQIGPPSPALSSAPARLTIAGAIHGTGELCVGQQPGTAPLKLAPPVLCYPEAYAWETSGVHAYWTDQSAVRHQICMADDFTCGTGAGTITGSGAAGEVTVWDGVTDITGYPAYTYSDALHRVSVAASDATTNGVTLKIANTSAATHSIAGVSMEANGGAVSALFGTWGLAEGPLSGSGSALGTATAHPLGFVINGSEVARFDSSGRLGIARTSPDAYLHVHHAAPSVLVTQGSNSGVADIRIGNELVDTGRMVALQYSGSSYSPSTLLTNGPDGESGALSTTGAYPLALGTGGQMRLTIQAATGGVGINTATIPSGGYGMAQFEIRGTDSSVYGPHTQWTTSGNSYPKFAVYPWTHDNVSLAWDAYHDGTNWRMADASGTTTANAAKSAYVLIKHLDRMALGGKYYSPAVEGTFTPDEIVRVKPVSTSLPGTFQVGVGLAGSDPAALLHLGAGTATAGTQPLLFTSGTANTSPVDGSMEWKSGEAPTFVVGGSRMDFLLGGAPGSPLTTYGVLYSGGAVQMLATAAGANGQCLTGHTGAAPDWQSCSGNVGSDDLPWRIQITAVPSVPTATTGFAPAANSSYWGGYAEQSTGSIDDSIEWDVALAAGTWSINLAHTTSTNRGIYTFSIDGSNVGTINGYSGSTVWLVTSTISGINVASTGKKRVKILMHTRDPANTATPGYYGTFVLVEFVRTA